MFEMQRWTFEITKDSVCDNWLICKKKEGMITWFPVWIAELVSRKQTKKTKMQFMIPVAPSN
jgi:hypothetical protein